jgi:hypothetical protein
LGHLLLFARKWPHDQQVGTVVQRSCGTILDSRAKDTSAIEVPCDKQQVIIEISLRGGRRYCNHFFDCSAVIDSKQRKAVVQVAIVVVSGDEKTTTRDGHAGVRDARDKLSAGWNEMKQVTIRGWRRCIHRGERRREDENIQ